MLELFCLFDCWTDSSANEALSQSGHQSSKKCLVLRFVIHHHMLLDQRSALSRRSIARVLDDLPSLCCTVVSGPPSLICDTMVCDEDDKLFLM